MCIYFHLTLADIAGIDFKESLVQLEFPDAHDVWNFFAYVKPDSGIWNGGVFKFSFEIPKYVSPCFFPPCNLSLGTTIYPRQK